jgi:DNA-binding MarR family transcriptional regulator
MINGGSDFLSPSKLLRKLHVLTEISNHPDISQHQLANRVGLSSSQINNYVQELRARELIKTKGNTNRTIRYLLTPEGEREKASLLIAYSVDVIQVYSRVKQEFSMKLQRICQEGIRKTVLFGAAETGELALTASKETDLSVVGVSDNDPKKHWKRFGDFTIIPASEIETVKPDGIVITSFGKIREICKSLRFLEERGIVVRSLTDV